MHVPNGIENAINSRHVLYRLVRKFIRWVVSSEKDVATTVTIYRLCVDGDMENITSHPG